MIIAAPLRDDYFPSNLHLSYDPLTINRWPNSRKKNGSITSDKDSQEIMVKVRAAVAIRTASAIPKLKRETESLVECCS